MSIVSLHTKQKKNTSSETKTVAGTKRYKKQEQNTTTKCFWSCTAPHNGHTDNMVKIGTWVIKAKRKKKICDVTLNKWHVENSTTDTFFSVIFNTVQCFFFCCWFFFLVFCCCFMSSHVIDGGSSKTSSVSWRENEALTSARNTH